MTKEIEPRAKLIKDYLSLGDDEMLLIPAYQRRYSWTIDQCDKLWQDIEAFIESDEKDAYFFGTVIADCSDDDGIGSGQKCIKLIDGQQRTTTFILLLKALFLRIQELLQHIHVDSESEGLVDGLKDRRKTIMRILYRAEAEECSELLSNWDKVKGRVLLASNSINELDAYKGDLQKIVEARNFEEAESSCYRIPRKQKDNKFTNFFRNFKYFYDKLSSPVYSQAGVNTFAKTFLGKCKVIEIRSWNTAQAITMFNSLNSTGMPLMDADIISAKLFSSSDDRRSEFIKDWERLNELVDELSSRKIVDMDSLLQQNMYIKRALDMEYMRNGKADVTTPGVRRYYTEQHKDLLDAPLALCERFYKLAKIWNHIEGYPLVKLLLKFNENAKLYLISYLNRYDADEILANDVNEVAELLLRLFAVLELVDSGYSSSNFKTFLFGENVKLVDGSVAIADIREDFNHHIEAKWERAELDDRLREYDGNILVYLNEYLYAKVHGEGESFDFIATTNVEHIMPASGHNRVAIREDAGIDNNDEFSVFVDLLGNKILLEEKLNKGIGNDWFRTKKQKSVKDKAGYKDSKFMLAKSLTEYESDRWTKVDISTATGKAAKRILDFIFGGIA